MKIFYCHEFVLPLPEGHRFPMEKYALLHAAIVRAAADSPDLTIELEVPPAATVEQLRRVHTADYIDAVIHGGLTPAQVREIGFPWSPELVERSRRSVGGTIAAAHAALRDGAAANLAGGTHHARADRGAGFCVFNDIAVAARDVQAEGLAQRVLVLDLDVHQGEGTAAVFARDRTVRTVSVHGANNYPFRKEQSDVDVALPDGAGDEAYLDAVRQALAAGLKGFAPDLVFYLAGADPYAGDALGRLAVTEAGLAARDALVVEAVRNCGGVLALSMGGGYAHDVDRTVAIHAHSVLASGELAIANALVRRR